MTPENYRTLRRRYTEEWLMAHLPRVTASVMRQEGYNERQIAEVLSAYSGYYARRLALMKKSETKGTRQL